MRHWMVLALVATALLPLGGCVDRAAQKQGQRTQQILQDKVMPVVVQRVATDTLSEALEITGQVTTSEDVMVGAKLPGRIVAVYVRDGDPVRAGQVIALQDASSYRLQAQQAQAQVAAARSALSQAISTAAVGPSRSAAALASAQAQLRSARAQLKKAQNGAREEERAQASNNVEMAKSSLATAKKDLERKRALFEEGVISRQQLDVSENAYQAALTQYENALQALRITQNAARPEDIESAKELVRQGEEAVRSAQAQKKLDVLLDDGVRAAKANVDAARAQLSLAQQSISDSQIRSPFSGKIAGKPVQVGAVMSGGTPVAHIIGAEGAYFEGEISENSVARIKLGGRVQVTVDALGGRSLSGTVVAVGPLGQEVGRLFKVRIQIAGDLAEVKPGMFARGSVILRTLPNVTVVPTVAVIQRGQQDYVFTVDGTKAKLIKIVTGLRKDGLVQVSGIAVGQSVVVSGQNMLDDGVKIRIEDGKADAISGGATQL